MPAEHQHQSQICHSGHAGSKGRKVRANDSRTMNISSLAGIEQEKTIQFKRRRRKRRLKKDKTWKLAAKMGSSLKLKSLSTTAAYILIIFSLFPPPPSAALESQAGGRTNYNGKVIPNCSTFRDGCDSQGQVLLKENRNKQEVASIAEAGKHLRKNDKQEERSDIQVENQIETGAAKGNQWESNQRRRTPSSGWPEFEGEKELKLHWLNVGDEGSLERSSRKVLDKDKAGALMVRGETQERPKRAPTRGTQVVGDDLSASFLPVSLSRMLLNLNQNKQLVSGVEKRGTSVVDEKSINTGKNKATNEIKSTQVNNLPESSSTSTNLNFNSTNNNTTQVPLSKQQQIQEQTFQRRLMELKQKYMTNRAISDRAYYILLVIYSLFIIVGTISNSLICLTVILKPKILSPRNIFIVNLAGSDLLLCVFTMPFSFIEISMKMWQMGLIPCKLVAGLQATSIFVSTISITAIALDRYKVIVYPTHQESASGTRSAALLLASVWIGALLLSLPLFRFRTVEHLDLPHKYDTIKSIDFCVEAWPFAHGRGIYSVISMMFQYVLPITIVSVVYAKISDKLQKRLIRRQRLTQLECQQKRQLNLIRRTHTMLISVSLIFGLSWLPLNLLNVIGDFSDLFRGDDQLFRVVFAICHLIGCSSACSNPILYGYLNENFRKEFHQVYTHHMHRLIRLCRRLSGRLRNADIDDDDDDDYDDDSGSSEDSDSDSDESSNIDEEDEDEEEFDLYVRDGAITPSSTIGSSAFSDEEGGRKEQRRKAQHSNAIDECSEFGPIERKYSLRPPNSTSSGWHTPSFSPTPIHRPLSSTASACEPQRKNSMPLPSWRDPRDRNSSASLRASTLNQLDKNKEVGYNRVAHKSAQSCVLELTDCAPSARDGSARVKRDRMNQFRRPELKLFPPSSSTGGSSGPKRSRPTSSGLHDKVADTECASSSQRELRRYSFQTTSSGRHTLGKTMRFCLCISGSSSAETSETGGLNPPTRKRQRKGSRALVLARSVFGDQLKSSAGKNGKERARQRGARKRKRKRRTRQASCDCQCHKVSTEVEPASGTNINMSELERRRSSNLSQQQRDKQTVVEGGAAKELQQGRRVWLRFFSDRRQQQSYDCATTATATGTQEATNFNSNNRMTINKLTLPIGSVSEELDPVAALTLDGSAGKLLVREEASRPAGAVLARATTPLGNGAETNLIAVKHNKEEEKDKVRGRKQHCSACKQKAPKESTSEHRKRRTRRPKKSPKKRRFLVQPESGAANTLSSPFRAPPTNSSNSQPDLEGAKKCGSERDSKPRLGQIEGLKVEVSETRGSQLATYYLSVESARSRADSDVSKEQSTELFVINGDIEVDLEPQAVHSNSGQNFASYKSSRSGGDKEDEEAEEKEKEKEKESGSENGNEGENKNFNPSGNKKSNSPKASSSSSELKEKEKTSSDSNSHRVRGNSMFSVKQGNEQTSRSAPEAQINNMQASHSAPLDINNNSQQVKLYYNERSRMQITTTGQSETGQAGNSSSGKLLSGPDANIEPPREADETSIRQLKRGTGKQGKPGPRIYSIQAGRQTSLGAGHSDHSIANKPDKSKIGCANETAEGSAEVSGSLLAGKTHLDEDQHEHVVLAANFHDSNADNSPTSLDVSPSSRSSLPGAPLDPDLHLQPALSSSKAPAQASHPDADSNQKPSRELDLSSSSIPIPIQIANQLEKSHHNLVVEEAGLNNNNANHDDKSATNKKSAENEEKVRKELDTVLTQAGHTLPATAATPRSNGSAQQTDSDSSSCSSCTCSISSGCRLGPTNNNLASLSNGSNINNTSISISIIRSNNEELSSLRPLVGAIEPRWLVSNGSNSSAQVHESQTFSSSLAALGGSIVQLSPANNGSASTCPSSSCSTSASGSVSMSTSAGTTSVSRRSSLASNEFTCSSSMASSALVSPSASCSSASLEVARVMAAAPLALFPACPAPGRVPRPARKLSIASFETSTGALLESHAYSLRPLAKQCNGFVASSQSEFNPNSNPNPNTITRSVACQAKQGQSERGSSHQDKNSSQVVKAIRGSEELNFNVKQQQLLQQLKSCSLTGTNQLVGPNYLRGACGSQSYRVASLTRSQEEMVIVERERFSGQSRKLSNRLSPAPDGVA